LTRFPTQLANRAAITIAETARAVRNAHQRLNTIGSQVSSLTPGSWELLTLQNGWSNVSGYIPAQVRILQNGMSQVVGHIQNGTTANNTVIATLTAGFYNAVHAHAFTVNAVTGASASAQAGNVSNTAISSTTTPGFSVPYNTFDVTVASNKWTAGPSNWHFDNVAGLSVSGQNLSNPATSTPVNMNTPTIHLDTSGNLTIQNVDPNVTQLSFSETLPLVTS
jgi:hypothetical protein